jgi:hypothetical protein
MDLKEFVSATLTQIVEGVIEAQNKVPGNVVNARMPGRDGIEKLGFSHTGDYRGVQVVKFDVALTTAEGTETKGKAGVFIAPFSLGSQGQSNASSASVSRVQFGVPLALPSKKDD